MSAPVRILHIAGDFTSGAAWQRTADVMAAIGRNATHTLVAADAAAVPPAWPRGVSAKVAGDFPKLTGRPLPGRLQKLAKAMRPFDLVLTYGWDALDAGMAHTMFRQPFALPPLIHHEDGLGAAEQAGLVRRRTWYRRIALGQSAGLVVPDERLEEAALVDWQQPLGRVKRIAPGIDVRAFAGKPDPRALRTIKREDECWIGTVAGPGAEGELARLVAALPRLDEVWHLVVLGQGYDVAALDDAIERHGVHDRVHRQADLPALERVMGLFDLFAASAVDGPVLRGMREAMAAGLAVVPDDKDLARAMLPDAPELSDAAAALVALTAGRDLRHEAGEANRRHALAEYDRAPMIAAYRRLYGSAAGRSL